MNLLFTVSQQSIYLDKKTVDLSAVVAAGAGWKVKFCSLTLAHILL